MTFTTWKSILCAALCAAAITLSAHAQTPAMKLEIPFEFQVGSMKCPAGTYQIAATRSSHIVTLSSKDGSHYVVGIAKPGAERARSGLMFHRAGGVYALAEVYWPQQSGIMIPPSKEVKKLIEELAARQGKPDEILVAQGR